MSPSFAGDKVLEKPATVAKVAKERMVNRIRKVGVTFGRVLAMLVELNTLWFLMIDFRTLKQLCAFFLFFLLKEKQLCA